MPGSALNWKTDGELELDEHHYLDPTTGATVYINDAVVTAEIVTPKGVSVLAGITLTHVAGSNGRYRWVTPWNAFDRRHRYIARVTAVSANAGTHFYAEIDFPVEVAS